MRACDFGAGREGGFGGGGSPAQPPPLPPRSKRCRHSSSRPGAMSESHVRKRNVEEAGRGRPAHLSCGSCSHNSLAERNGTGGGRGGGRGRGEAPGALTYQAGTAPCVRTTGVTCYLSKQRRLGLVQAGTSLPAESEGPRPPAGARGPPVQPRPRGPPSAAWAWAWAPGAAWAWAWAPGAAWAWAPGAAWAWAPGAAAWAWAPGAASSCPRPR